MSRWQTETLIMNKRYPLKTNQDLLDFVNFALTHSVDYIYILGTIQDFLEGYRGDWTPDNYIDY